MSAQRRALLAAFGVGLAALGAARLPEAGAARAAPLLGRYRGTVADNNDPERLARIRVNVPAVGEVSEWASPSSPYAGVGIGLVAIPPVGAEVWIEFEEGDPDHPIWTGALWGSSAEVPGGGSPTSVTLAAPGGTIAIHDRTGIALATNRVRVDGAAEFERSGIVVVPTGRSAAAKALVSVGARSVVLATVQGVVPGVFLGGVVTLPGKGFTVHLSGRVSRPVRVAWLVLDRP